VAFWIAAVGGVLAVLGELVGSAVLEIGGGVLFLAGTTWFFIAAFRRARAEDVGFLEALGRSGKDALRFAASLMP
jgi:hypothetical protein